MIQGRAAGNLNCTVGAQDYSTETAQGKFGLPDERGDGPTDALDQDRSKTCGNHGLHTPGADHHDGETIINSGEMEKRKEGQEPEGLDPRKRRAFHR